jgi:hypothetical protein
MEHLAHDTGLAKDARGLLNPLARRVDGAYRMGLQRRAQHRPIGGPGARATRSPRRDESLNTRLLITMQHLGHRVAVTSKYLRDFRLGNVIRAKQDQVRTALRFRVGMIKTFCAKFMDRLIGQSRMALT